MVGSEPGPVTSGIVHRAAQRCGLSGRDERRKVGEMLDAIRHARRLRKLQRHREQITSDYKTKTEIARKEGKSSEELYKIGEGEHFDVIYIDDEIDLLQSMYVRRQAEKLLLSVPKFDKDGGDWEQSDRNGKWRLTRRASSELRVAIRQEQRERRQHWQAALALLIGLVGALIGLVSLLVDSSP